MHCYSFHIVNYSIERINTIIYRMVVQRQIHQSSPHSRAAFRLRVDMMTKPIGNSVSGKEVSYDCTVYFILALLLPKSFIEKCAML